MTHEDEDIGYLLRESVPPLRTPPDRVGAVGRRVRRHRRRRVGLGALAVALVAGLAFGGVRLGTGNEHSPAPPAVTPTVDDQARCPTDAREFPDPRTARYGGNGPLVPAGAVEIVACEVPATEGAEPREPRVLTDGVDEIVRVLDALPPWPVRPGAATPAGDHELRCTAVARHHELAYVLRYPDRPSVTVHTSGNCQTVRQGPSGRGLDPALFDTFLQRYREQLAARTPAVTIATPTCPPSLPTGRLRLTPTRTGPPDRIRVNNPGGNPGLPTRLVAVAACRYEVGDTLARLTGQRRERDDADALRPALNATFERDRVTDCGSYPGYPPPTGLDVLLVADATGATAEFWLRRAPCGALVAGRSSGITPTETLLTGVDRMFGPSPR
ncbi:MULTISPECIES: hypothetical protein [Micromonospora]|uniref:Uncharacterized protein n=1 Tax=Micromonospora yangpuensis TaxID=683228 RepID=A0A1C6V5G0_9ACTN|nr:hypothetical protein [Micromonospora yangpuensis]GGM18355.1 hypothetical protein GCM10012279_40750 [Micromonospora yangpuensis]SCL61505.1 hypothetical protein GA0070617_4683 [Micromonospora yangpuensis]